MGFAQKILPHYTYEDWVRWEGKWELIEGFPFAMSPAPIPKHQRVSAQLILLFGKALENCKKCTVYDPIDYKIEEDTIVQPDILIVCDEIEKPYLDFPPALIVEILSPSTALRDRHTKYELYQQQGVKYYLIVDIDKKSIEIYQLINYKYELQNNNGPFTFDLNGCNIQPELDKVW